MRSALVHHPAKATCPCWRWTRPRRVAEPLPSRRVAPAPQSQQRRRTGRTRGCAGSREEVAWSLAMQTRSLTTQVMVMDSSVTISSIVLSVSNTSVYFWPEASSHSLQKGRFNTLFVSCEIGASCVCVKCCVMDSIKKAQETIQSTGMYAISLRPYHGSSSLNGPL